MNPEEEEEEDQTPSYPFLIGMATRIMRARWVVFLRRVFHHQNGSGSSDPASGSGPFDTKAWMMVELMALVIQIMVSSVTLAISEKERPVWPMRVWVGGYDVGCVMSLMMLYGKYHCRHVTTTTTRHGDLDLGLGISHVEEQREDDGDEETRSSELMNKCRSTLELLFAIWFVMGNFWIFNSRLGSFQNAPKLHILCISLLAYNAISYSFPFFLFLLICCFLPLLTAILTNYDDFTISSPSHYHHHHHRGASNHQISLLPSWTYHKLQDHGNDNDDDECCICLAKYKEKEQVRKLPCSHVFHQVCVDQWLRIISCCPLCKQGLES